MYANTGYRVRVSDHLSPRFIASLGVKQGCCLSPMLSNINQNDLYDIFKTGNCDPVVLGDMSLNSLSWADDLMLISTTTEGLQECLNKLYTYSLKWGLEKNVEKTKTMALYKKKCNLAMPLAFGNSLLDNVESYEYLGFKLKYNNDVSHVISNRASKAQRVTHMIMQAISNTDKNVSPRLSLNLFDKQIVPIMHYGAAVWSVPRKVNLVYLHGQRGTNTRNIVLRLFREKCGRDIPFVYARRSGSRITGEDERKILVRLKYYSDIEVLLREHSDIFSDYVIKQDTEVEKLHNYFCKRTLNVSKYASTNAVSAELGRMLITHKAWGLVKKYWLRLENGTRNKLLNEAYATAKRNYIDWIQSVQCMLCRNGFRDVWLNPSQYDYRCFHRVFVERLDDQYRQTMASFFTSSTRFKTLALFKDGMNMSSYITSIHNPNICIIYTRLRIDMNCLSTCKTRKRMLNGTLCNLCKSCDETVDHFLLNCKHFDDIRRPFINDVRKYTQSNLTYDQDRLLNFVLDLQCPPEAIPLCCKFVYKMYTKRETVWCNQMHILSIWCSLSSAADGRSAHVISWSYVYCCRCVTSTHELE